MSIPREELEKMRGFINMLPINCKSAAWGKVYCAQKEHVRLNVQNLKGEELSTTMNQISELCEQKFELENCVLKNKGNVLQMFKV